MKESAPPLSQVLAALSDLHEATRHLTDPEIVSARQQAKVLLARSRSRPGSKPN